MEVDKQSTWGLQSRITSDHSQWTDLAHHFVELIYLREHGECLPWRQYFFVLCGMRFLSERIGVMFLFNMNFEHKVRTLRYVSPRTIAFLTCAAVTFLGMKPKSGSLATAAAVELLPSDSVVPRWWRGRCWRYGLSAMLTRDHGGKSNVEYYHSKSQKLLPPKTFQFHTWSTLYFIIICIYILLCVSKTKTRCGKSVCRDNRGGTLGSKRNVGV